MTHARQLHKFGGSSLADPECYLRVAKILKSYSKSEDLVVVSAAGKTTNRLISFVEELSKDGRIAHETLHALRQYQSDLITKLLTAEAAEPLLSQLQQEISVLGEAQCPSEQRAIRLGAWSW